MSESERKVQGELLDKNRAVQEEVAATVAELAAKVSASREALATSGDDADGSKQFQLTLDEVRLAKAKAKQEALIKHGRSIGEGEIYEEAPAALSGMWDIKDPASITADTTETSDEYLADMAKGDETGSKWEKKKKQALIEWQKRKYPEVTQEAFEQAMQNARLKEVAGEIGSNAALKGLTTGVLPVPLPTASRRGMSWMRKSRES